MSTQSKELTAFYKSYLDWLDVGAPHEQPYSRKYGLCSNILHYYFNSNWRNYYPIKEEMKNQFDQAGIHTIYPFEGSKYHYHDAAEHRKLHLNPARIQWVRDHAYG